MYELSIFFPLVIDQNDFKNAYHVALLTLQSFFFSISFNKQSNIPITQVIFFMYKCVFNVFNTHTTGKDKLKIYE